MALDIIVKYIVNIGYNWDDITSVLCSNCTFSMFPFWHVKSEFTKVKVSSMIIQILVSDDGQNVYGEAQNKQKTL